MSEQDKGGNAEKECLLVDTNAQSHIKHVFAVVSGKGGVGKSAVTALLATSMMKKGKKCAIIDADITGPSIPMMFGVKDQILGNADLMFPAVTKKGLKLISVNLLIDEPSKPVLWRGPVIGGAVKQFWTDVEWGDIDYLFIDCPPGTGDVALTVFQNVKVDGVIVVATPQDLVSMIVGKAINMAKLMNIPVFGLIENMSYSLCPHCGERIDIYGKSKVPEISKKFGIPILAEIPHDVKIAEAGDSGKFEELNVNYVNSAVKMIEKSFPV